MEVTECIEPSDALYGVGVGYSLFCWQIVELMYFIEPSVVLNGDNLSC